MAAGGSDDLLDDELIDSRALESASGDRFRHADLVTELVALVRTVPTPANVALFAPWGSGKSGMGNMLAASLKDDPSIRFVKFDAFKFGKAPLRRHFISQVAKGLGHHETAFSDELYQSIEDRKVKFPSKDLLALGVAFLAALTLVVICLLLLAVFAAAVSVGGFTANWSHVVKDFLLPALPIAVVVTIFIKMAADGLVVKSVRSAPSGDEEFERLFTRLVKKTKNRHVRRIVVFVDELDRCSPIEVTSTLETIKTFLEVEGCVFVVAADHQVLEQALRKKARQETPVDPANPYYSAGSSYLDKIFQYQYQIPPLKSDRLTEFALELVRERSGVWQRVENLPEVVSVLIPTHVSSPRRVKVLLNSFALTYRLAERRASDGVLDSHLPGRASEIAKLVCLRCEFPLFAEDLTRDARLPDLVRTLAEGETPRIPVLPDVLARAKDYAQGRLPVAEYLVEDDSRLLDALESRLQSSSESTDAAPTVVASDEGGDETQSEDEKPPEEDVSAEPPRTSEVAAMTIAHAQQLVRYLRKVAYIPGPGVDLIYLESAGALVGLPPEIADTLERAAVDGDYRLVQEIVEPLDEPGQRSAIKLLASLVRGAPVGIEGQNVVSTLLSTISRTSLRLADAAEEVANAVAGHERQIQLRPEDLSGALILGLDSGSEVGDRLRDQVLNDDVALSRADVAAAVVCRAASVPSKFDKTLGQAAATLLVGQEDDTFVDALRAVTDEQATRVLGMTLEPMQAAISRGAPSDEAEENPAVKKVAIRLGVVIRGLGENDQPSARVAATTLAVQSELVPIQQAAFPFLAELEPITDQGLIASLVDTAPRYKTVGWPNMLGRIDPTALAALPDVGTSVARLASTLWRRSVLESDARDSDDDSSAGLAVLEKFMVGNVAIDRDSLRDVVGDTLTGAFATDADVERQAHLLKMTERLVLTGMLERQTLADLDLGCCIATLESPRQPEADPESQQVPGALYDRVVGAASSASSENIQRATDAIEPSAWLTEAQKASARVLLSAAQLRFRPEAVAPFSPQEVADIRARDGEAFDPALAVWLDVFHPSPEDLWTALSNLATGSLPAAVADALRSRSLNLSSSDKFALAEIALNDPDRSPSPEFLRAIRFSEAAPAKVAAAITRIAGDATTAAQRETALVLWGEFKPTGQTTQEGLINNIYLPLAKRGGEDLDMAVSHFGLVSSQRGKLRSAIMEALTSSASDDQRQRIEDRLKEAGWLKRGGLLGRGAVVKIDEDK